MGGFLKAGPGAPSVGHLLKGHRAVQEQQAQAFTSAVLKQLLFVISYGAISTTFMIRDKTGKKLWLQAASHGSL